MTVPEQAAASPAASLREHARRTLALALPVMVARAGLIVLIAVDTAMSGHADAKELAYYGLGLAPQMPMILVGVGLLMGRAGSGNSSWESPFRGPVHSLQAAL